MKKVLLGVLWAGALAAFFLLGGNRYLQLETLLAYRDDLKMLTAQHTVEAALGFAVIYTTATALSIPGASILSLLAGFLFGRWLGTVIVVSAATLGAVLVFALSRYLFADWAKAKLEHSPKARQLIAGFAQDAFNYLLFLRLAPVFPFWLVNIAPALTPVSVGTYTWATLIGIIPGSFVYVNLGQTLGTIDHLDDLISGQVLLALGLLAFLAITPVITKRFWKTHKSHDD